MLSTLSLLLFLLSTSQSYCYLNQYGFGHRGLGSSELKARSSFSNRYREENADTPSSTSQTARVFVSNLKFDTTQGELREFMEAAGKVKAVNLFQRPDGRPVGSAVVEFFSHDDAGKAIQQLHENEFLGRRVFVREDREQDSMEVKTPRFERNRERQRENRDDSIREPRNEFQKYREPMRATQKFRNREGDQYAFDFRDNERGEDRRRRFNDAPRDDRGSFQRQGRFKSDSSSNGEINEDIRKILIVENLPLRFSWQDLKDIIKEYGSTVRVDVVSLPPSEANPKRQNIGIAEFRYREDVQSILENPPVSDRFSGLRYRAVQSKEEYLSFRQNTPRGKRLYIGNISRDVTWELLKDHFKSVGEIVKASVIHKDLPEREEGEGAHDEDSPRRRRRNDIKEDKELSYGIVEFRMLEDADKAVQLLNGSILGDASNPIVVRKFLE